MGRGYHMVTAEEAHRLLGRPATLEEIDRINHLTAALGVKSNDPLLWLVILLVGFGGEYGRIPGKIESATAAACDAAVRQARKKLEIGASEVQAALARTVSEAAQKAARAASVSTMLEWIVIAVMGCALVIGLLMCLVYSHGVESGRMRGFAEARNEALALQQRDEFWASPLGKRVIALHEKGELGDYMDLFESQTGKLLLAYSPGLLHDILTCSLEKWEVEKDKDGRKICFPKRFGFRLPEEGWEQKTLLERIKS